MIVTGGRVISTFILMQVQVVIDDVAIIKVRQVQYNGSYTLK
jgi:hypothetical protein